MDSKEARRYNRINNSKRSELVDMVKLPFKQVTNQGILLKDAAKLLGINYSTAKTILRVYRKERRSIRKYRCNETKNPFSVGVLSISKESKLNELNERYWAIQSSQLFVPNSRNDKALTDEERSETKIYSEGKSLSKFNMFFPKFEEIDENRLYNIANKLYTKINSYMRNKINKEIGKVISNINHFPIERIKELLSVMN